MLVLIFALTFATAALLANYLSQREHNPTRRRILESGAPTPIRPPHLEGSIAKRVLAPTVRNFGDLLGRLLPTSIARNVEMMLVQAGQPMNFQNFLSLWFIVAASSVAFVALFIAPSTATGRLIIWGGFCIAFGFLVPYSLLGRRARKRRAAIDRALPDALDLLVTSIEAGLGIDAAFALVAERTKGPLATLFVEYLRQVGLGRSRREALNSVAERSGSEGLTHLAMVVNQSTDVGASIGDVLRIQAAEMRSQRRMRAEEVAQKRQVWLAVPLALCFMPAMIAVIVVPSVLNLMNYVGDLGK